MKVFFFLLVWKMYRENGIDATSCASLKKKQKKKTKNLKLIFLFNQGWRRCN